MQPTKNATMDEIIKIRFFVAIFMIGLYFCFSSCQNNFTTTDSYTANYKMMPIIEDNHITKEHHYVIWKPKTSNNTQFLNAQFHGKIATLWFDKGYVCLIKKTSNRTFNLYWPQKSFSKSKMWFLNQSHGVEDFPKKGDLFSTYTVVNDSLIKVEYNFPEWIENVNQIAKDSIFPKYLYYFE